MARRRSKQGKRKREATRTRAAVPKKVRSRLRWIAVLAVLGGAIGLYVYDLGGPMETIRGQVVRVRTYDHPSGLSPHTHTEAVIEYEGVRHTLPRADGLTQGQGVLVDVRRGRLSGRPRYVSFRGTESDAVATEPGSVQPEPWEYDLLQNKYWDPVHGHWHDGRPPPLDER